jgi:hypothetical protein
MYYFIFLKIPVLVDTPWQEAMNEVLQFFNSYYHIKFQANISNGSRVLEAIPSKIPDSGNFWEFKKRLSVAIFNTIIINCLQPLIFAIFIKCVFQDLLVSWVTPSCKNLVWKTSNWASK